MPARLLLMLFGLGWIADEGCRKQALNARCVYRGKPRIEKGKILKLLRNRKAEEIAYVTAAAVLFSAAAFPLVAIDSVQSVIDKDFLPSSNISLREKKSFLKRRVNVAVRVAGIIDVGFWRPHQDDRSVREKVPMFLQFSRLRSKWVDRIDNSRIIQTKDDRPLSKRLGGEYPITLDRGTENRNPQDCTCFRITPGQNTGVKDRHRRKNS